jgi:hypothetical protein
MDAAADAAMEANNRELSEAEAYANFGWYLAQEMVFAGLGGVGGAGDDAARLADDAARGLRPTRSGAIGLRQLRPGQAIPPEFVNQTGYTLDHIQELAAYARRSGNSVTARTTNPHSLWHLSRGAHPKPMGIKPKSIGELDVLLGATRENRGTVGLFQPRMPNTSGMSDDLVDALRERLAMRSREMDDYYDIMKNSDEFDVVGGQVINRTTGRPFAGDMDMVTIRGPNGEILRGQAYNDAVSELVELGLAQHGAETGIVAHFTRGLTPGTPAYNAAVDKALQLSGDLQWNHLRGAEIAVEMTAEGVLRIPPKPVVSLPQFGNW